MPSNLERALDTYLAAAAKAGDLKASEDLVRRWSPKLSAFAWRLLGRADLVEDAVQEAWLEIFKALPKLTATEAFPAFAFRITQRRCARFIKRLQSDRRLTADLCAEPEPPMPGTSEIEQSADADKVRSIMATLPPDQHAALWLYHMQGFSVQDIALALDVPAGTVKTRLMHARRKIAAQIQGGDHE